MVRIIMANEELSVDNISNGSNLEPKKEWRDIGVDNLVKIGIVGGLFFLLFKSEMSDLLKLWVEDSSWSHGFLIPLFSLWFINQNKRNIINLETKPNYFGLVLLILGLVFYPINIVHFQYGYFRPLTVIFCIGAIVLFLGGWRLIKYTWLPIGFLIFAVPIPQRYYVKLTQPLQMLAAQVAGILLGLVKDLDTSVTGVIIDVIYKGQKMEPGLNVAEACSGMRLLMAFLALGVAMAYIHYRPVWQRIVLLISTIPIAILCNIIRVSITGFIYVLISPVYAQGIYHDMLGILMLPLAFGMYGFLAWFMSSLFVDEKEQVAKDVIVRKKSD
jgi:exosortase